MTHRRYFYHMTATSNALTAAGLALAIALILPGCANNDGTQQQTNGTMTGESSKPMTDTPRNDGQYANVVERLDAEYVVGYTPARELGYRIDWQSSANARNGVVEMRVEEDSVFVLDGQNFLCRFRRNDGVRLWRVAVADPVTKILGVLYLPDLERVYVCSDSRVIQLDAANGGTLTVQRLQRVAATAPLRLGDYLVYGSVDGQIVWHNHVLGRGYVADAYRIADAIDMQPVLEAGNLVTISPDGHIWALDASAAQQLWNKKLLDGVVAPPAATKMAVYVAGLDQNIWAIDMFTGRVMWNFLTEYSLRESPVVIGDQVYQPVPNEGLMCFEAAPLNRPGGVVQWTARDVNGNVVARRNNQVFVWNDANNMMTVLTQSRGDVVKEVSLPNVGQIKFSSLEGEELFAVNSRGDLTRLTAQR